MTDPKEARRQIEEAVEFIQKAHYFDDYHNRERQRLLAELASLRSILEANAGEDEVELDSILHTLRIKRFNQDDWQDVEHIDRARKLLSRLSARANLTETERTRLLSLEAWFDVSVKGEGTGEYGTDEWREKFLIECLDDAKGKFNSKNNQDRMENAKREVKILSAKAKLGEAEILKAKREVLNAAIEALQKVGQRGAMMAGVSVWRDGIDEAIMILESMFSALQPVPALDKEANEKPT